MTKEAEIERRLDAIVANDAGMKLIVERLGELLKNLPQIFDRAKEEDNKRYDQRFQ